MHTTEKVRVRQVADWLRSGRENPHATVVRRPVRGTATLRGFLRERRAVVAR
jgi:hypothetical protein